MLLAAAGRVKPMTAKGFHNDFDDGRPHRPGVTTEFLERNNIKRVHAEEAHQRVGYKAAGTLIPYFHF